MQTVSLITISATFFLVLFTKAAKSQNDFRFADSISTWNILEKYTSLTSQVISYKTLVFFTSKDTFISSKNYQIIKTDDPFILGSEYYLRVDSSHKVFIYNIQGEYLLYNFDVTKHDTIFNLKNEFFLNRFNCVTDSIDTIFLFKDRKRIFVRCTFENENNFNLYDVWIEGIGSLNTHFLFPYANPSIFDGPDFLLLCHFYDNNQLYQSSLYTSCEIDSIWTGIRFNNQFPSISIVPNPSKNEININTFSFNSVASMYLTDYTGKLLKTYHNYQETIPLSDLPNGLYFLTIHLTNGTTHTRKIIKQ